MRRADITLNGPKYVVNDVPHFGSTSFATVSRFWRKENKKQAWMAVVVWNGKEYHVPMHRIRRRCTAGEEAR